MRKRARIEQRRDRTRYEFLVYRKIFIEMNGRKSDMRWREFKKIAVEVAVGARHDEFLKARSRRARG